MADDLGYADLGCYGCKDIPTPNIDKIAAEGTRFTDSYVTWPMCGPSRAGFLTGKQQWTFGYYENVSAPFDTDPEGVIRECDLKLIITKKGVELYDLKDDLSETTNIASSHPEKVKAMQSRWTEWNKAKQPPLWKGGENIQHADYDWLKGSPHYKSKQ